jgi:hypothetical protein
MKEEAMSDKDTAYTPSSETESDELQHDQSGSPAFDDQEIDASAVRVLPGTGGPDDPGDIRVDESDIEEGVR